MHRFTYVVVLVLTGALAPLISAQDKPKSNDTSKTSSTQDPNTAAENAAVPLKVTVVFNEYDGEKKVSSLPYTLFLKSAEEHRDYFGTIRMGVRVPIWTGSKDSAVQYQDVGSNIDCEARPTGEGRYFLDLRLERSSIYTPKEEHSPDQRSDEQPHQPLLRTFRANVAVMLHDGQTTQTTVATDPLNGHIVKVDVTLNVVK
jgi:hypothetical protein